VTAPVSLKVSSTKVKRSTKQTVTVGKVSKGQAVTARVNGKIVAKATVRGNGSLASVRTVRTNRAKVPVKASGKTGFKVQGGRREGQWDRDRCGLWPSDGEGDLQGPLSRAAGHSPASWGRYEGFTRQPTPGR